ncbi:MAG: PAS domain S-box protein, partial [Candidatus Thorarchaeota archaeon]
TNTEGIIDYVNPKFTEMTGYSSAEVIGKNPSLLQSGITPPETYSELWEYLTAGKEWHGEFVNRKKNGITYWEDALISPIVDSNGDTTHYMAIKQDITAQRQVDDALKRSEERFRNIFESSPNGMFIYELQEDDRLIFFDSNPAADRILGIDCSDFIGKTIEEAFPPLRDSEIPARYREAASKGTPWHLQQYTNFRDGVRGIYEIDAFQITKNKVVTAFVDITKRITAQEELTASEERYRRVIEDQTEFIIRWKADGVRTFANDSYCTFCGLTREEAVGTSFYDMISDEDLVKAKERIAAITPENPVSTAVLQTTLTDGSKGWTEWTDRGIFDEVGNLIEYQSTGRDITNRKKAEKALFDSEVRFSQLFQHAPIGVTLAGINGTLSEVNIALVKMLGYSQEEFRSMTVEEFTHPDDWKLERNLNHELKKGIRDSYALEKRYFHKDGQIVWGRLSVSIRRSEEGEITHIIAAVEDITEERNAKEKLQESEETFRAVFEQAAVGVARTDLAGNFLEVNKTLESMLGYNTSELLETNVFAISTPEDEKREKQLCREMYEGKRNSYQMMKRFFRKDGQMIWGRLTVSLVRREGEDTDFHIGILEDFTAQYQAEEALRESESQFKAIFERARIGMTLVSPDDSIMDVNAAFQEMSGYSLDELRQMKIADITHPEDIDVDNVHFQEIEEGKTESYRMVKRYIRKDGSLMWGNLTVNILRDASGNINFIVGMIEDISDRKRAEERLLEEKLFTETALNSQFDTFFVFNPRTGQAIRWNTTFSKVSGYTDEEIASMKAPDSYYDENDLTLAAENVAVIEREGQASLEISLITKDGKRIPFEYKASLMIDAPSGEHYIVSVGRDISVRKLAEQKIIEERNRAQMYLDIAGVMFVALDSEGLVTLMNQRGLEILGYEENEVIGKDWFHMFVPEKDRERTHGVFEQLMKGDIEPVEYFKNHVVAKNGETHIIAWHNTILKDSEGNIIGTFSSGEDITEQQQAEDALRENEKKYRMLFHQSADGIFLRDMEGYFIDVNPSFLKMTGYTRDELIGSSVLELLTITDIESRMLMKQVESTGSGVYEGNILKKNGELLAIEIKGALVEGEDHKFVQGILRDISKLKAAEERARQNHEDLQSIFDSIDDLLFILDMEGNVIQSNLTAANRLGYTMEEMVNLHALELHPPDRRDEAAEILQQMADGKTTHCPVPLLCKDGSIIPVDTRITLGRMSGNDILIGLTRDVSNRHKMEEELRASEERYRTIIENLPLVSWISDAHGNTIYISPNVDQVYGYSQEEIYKHGEDLWFGRIHPEDFDRVQKSIKELFENDGQYDVEYRIQRKDGVWIWLHDWSTGFSKSGEEVFFSGVFKDITEQKRIEDTLTASENNLRAIVENSPDHILLLDLNANIVFINRTIPGFDKEDVLGFPLYNFRTPEESEALKGRLEHIIETLETVEYEAEYESSSVGLIVFNNRIRPVLKNGEVIGFTVNSHDITEYKRASEGIREEKDRVEKYCEISGSIILSLDLSGNVTHINRTGCEILGYEENEIIGQNWFDNFIPERLKDILWDVHRKAISGSVTDVEGFENPILTKSGEEKMITWRNVDLQEEGRIVGVLSTGVDITEREQAKGKLVESEQRYRALFENTNDAIFLIDLDGNHITVNEQGAKLTGHTVEELIGKPLWDNVAEDEIAESKQVMETLQAGVAVPVYERTLVTKDGISIPVEINVTLAYDSEGHPLHIQS